MPRISEFFGLTVYMYWLDHQQHSAAHIHVRYQGTEAVFTLGGACIQGDLGPRATRLVRDWCSERATELLHAWECATAGKEIPWVLPLR